jgi:selenocysteine lyase/cysteine desulfurase
MMNYSQRSLLNSFSANPGVYVALPTGSGSTGAIEKAIKMLKSVETPETKPDIFLSPYEHHSNILPWI